MFRPNHRIVAWTAALGLLITSACSSPEIFGQNPDSASEDDTVTDGMGGADTDESSGNTGSGGQSSGTESSSSGGNGEPQTCSGGDTSVHEGQATWYELDTPLVNCSYETNSLPAFYGAMNTADYAGSAICGSCVRVEGPKGSVDIQIVDQCPIDTNPICYAGHIDLNPAAFEQIADLVTGVVPITWQHIPCDDPGTLTYHFKEGSSSYWTALMVRNHRYAIDKVEYLKHGEWKQLERQEYNYFVAEDGMGSGPYTIRVTDVYGQVVEDDDIPLELGTAVQGDGQFSICE